MDEKTPHMHYGVVPITDDGRLSAKEVVGNKKALTEFQDRFNEHVKQRGYNLERGQSRQVTNAKHEQMSQYKQKTEYHKQEYERESQKTDFSNFRTIYATINLIYDFVIYILCNNTFNHFKNIMHKFKRFL